MRDESWPQGRTPPNDNVISTRILTVSVSGFQGSRPSTAALARPTTSGRISLREDDDIFDVEGVRMARTVIDLDEAAWRAAAEELGTTTKVETV
ncbi:MAG: hypothetical protein ACRDYX_04150, partial [Egibacteraceae bacterium]